ncbi:MAG: Lar family restriction alleviation protein [Thermotogota bacterium]|nr:Lar family restriction alleviation protein [Thermotogota bacterium]
MTNQKELKPCPFCGGKVLICVPLEGVSGYVIRCELPGCCEKSSRRDETTKEDLEKLIESWNNRSGVIDDLLNVVEGWKVLKYHSGYWRMSCMKGESLRTFTSDSAVGAVNQAVSWGSR